MYEAILSITVPLPSLIMVAIISHVVTKIFQTEHTSGANVPIGYEKTVS